MIAILIKPMWMKASPIGVIHVRRQRLIWYPHPLEFWGESLGIHLLHDTVLREASETSRNIQKHRKLEVFLDTPTDTKTHQFFETTGRRAEKKNIHKSQWFSGFRPHLHRHQLVDTGIMMYNGAPILPLAFEAFMIPCIRALPTPNWSKTKKAEFHVHFPSLVLDLSGVNAHHHFAQHQKLMASITRYYTYV